MWRYAIMAMACAVAFHSAAAHAEVVVEQFTLTNGMEVYVVPNHRVPAVSHTIWFNVGAGDDPKGKSGLSHYLEHMMFQGTKKFPDDTYSRTVSSLGGQNNAFTGHDFTAYYVNIAKDKLPRIMELEADRMTGLTPSKDDAPREREVILEERKLTLDSKPASRLNEQMDAALYLNHPYQISVIGWKHEMEGLTAEDVMSHYRNFYRPANAFLVVAGDITAKELRPLAEKYYGRLPAGKSVAREWTKEPPASSERTVILRDANVTQPALYKNYLASSLVYGDTTQALPLMVFSQIIGGGETSRLYQSLVVNRKVAASVSAYYSPLRRGPSEFLFVALPAPEVSVDTLRAALEEEIVLLLKEAPSAQEIARAKTQIKADDVYARDSLEGIANGVGQVRALGLGMEYITHWAKLVDAVTPEQMMEAARLTLVPEASVTGLLLPKTETQP